MKGLETQTHTPPASPPGTPAAGHRVARLRERATANECGSTAGLSSLVSFPKRNNCWGENCFRGNCDGTLFKELVHRYARTRVGDPMLGSGTTAHVIDDMRHHGLTSISYWGSDLRRGFNLLTHTLPGTFDFIWMHPPYWDIIRYEKHPGDLSSFDDYSEFLEALKTCMLNCRSALSDNGRLAVLVGDIRRRGRYYPLGSDVAAMAPLVGELRSVIIKAQHHCTSDGRSYTRMEDPPIKHETCLIFKRVSAGAR